MSCYSRSWGGTRRNDDIEIYTKRKSNVMREGGGPGTGRSEDN